MLQAHLGYAADSLGNGIAYARLTSRTGERLVRVAFRVQRFSGLDAREVGYGAVAAIATLLGERGIESVEFYIPDEQLVADVSEHRAVPPPIVLPYVRLGCALNRMKDYALCLGSDPDLSQRALAEVTFSTAA
jgi:hypothetical protein